MTRWALAGVRLPDSASEAEAVRGLAIGAAWAHTIIASPPRSPVVKDERRCPVLPRCFPVAQPNGLVAVTKADKFHGVEIREGASCPFR